MRRIAPWATTQYWQSFAAEVATTIISRSALVSVQPGPVFFSINASW
jgi:hypothetical protein